MKLSEVVERIRYGDYTDFGVLYERTYKEIYFTALGILLDSGLADEVLQDTFVSFLGFKGSYKKGTNVHRHLIKIAKEKSYDLIRSIDRMDFDEAKSLGKEDDLMSILPLLDRVEEREIIIYRDILGYGWLECARTAGVTRLKAKARYRRAIKKLRKKGYIGEKGEDVRRMIKDSAAAHNIANKQTRVFNSIVMIHKAEAGSGDFVPMKRHRRFRNTMIVALVLLGVVGSQFAGIAIYNELKGGALVTGDTELLLAEELYLMDLVISTVEGEIGRSKSLDDATNKLIDYTYGYMRFVNLARGAHGVSTTLEQNNDQAYSYAYKLSVSSSVRPGFVTYFNERKDVAVGNSISGVFIKNGSTYHYEASWIGKDASAVMELTAVVAAHTTFTVVGTGNNELGEHFSFDYLAKGENILSGDITVPAKTETQTKANVILAGQLGGICIDANFAKDEVEYTAEDGVKSILVAYYYDKYYLFVLEDGTNVKVENAEQ